jgi:hypothetical protein
LADLLSRRAENAEALERLALVEASIEGSPMLAGDLYEGLARQRVAALRSRITRDSRASTAESTRARDELEREYAAFLAMRRKIPLRPGGIGVLHWALARELIAERIESELALDPTEQGIERALDATLRAQTVGTFARQHDLEDATVARIRAGLLPDGVGLALLMPALECTHLFLLDATSAGHVRLDRRDDVLAAARAFSAIVQTPPARNASAAERAARAKKLADEGGRLAAMLFPEEARRAMRQWRGFYCCGSELIESPPIEALAWDDGRFLGTAMAVCHLPSAAAGSWCLEQSIDRAAADLDLVVLTSPVHGEEVRKREPELSPIDPSSAELARICAGFRPDRIQHLRGGGATLDEIEVQSRRCDLLLEIFSHGMPSFDAERPAAIIVTPSPTGAGLLDCNWIEAHLEPPPIVALYACGSGLGPTRLGDDTAAQLGNALLSKRARVVLLSRSHVAYGAMVELARAFHERLGDARGDPGEALRSAREALARSEEWQDPFFFGTVTMLGPGLSKLDVAAEAKRRAPPSLESRDGSARTYFVVAGGAIVLLVVSTWVLRKRSMR